MNLRTLCRSILLLCGVLKSLSLAAVPNDESRGPLVFRSLQVRDGLPQMSVLDIAQDDDGYMWFATRDGIARWDGVQFDVFKEDQTEPSLSDNYATALCADGSGAMWIGTLNGLNRYDIRSNRFRNFFAGGAQGLSDNRISGLYRDSAQQLWVLTHNGMSRYRAGDDTFEHFLQGPAEEPFRIQCLTETIARDTLLVGNSDGLFRFVPEAGSLSKLVLSETSRPDIRTLFKDRRGNIWVGTANEGIYLLDPHLRLRSRFRRGDRCLNNDFVRCIREDRGGNILIATFDGLNIYDPAAGTFRSYRIGNTEESLSFFSLHSIFCDRSNTVWLGSYVGGVNYYNNDFVQPLRFDRPLLDGMPTIGVVGPMVCDNRGIWIGLEGGGLLHYDLATGLYRQFKLPGDARDMRSNIINSLCKHGDRLWVGLNNGRVLEIDLRRGTLAANHAIPGAATVVSLYADIDRYLYVGTIDKLGSHALMVITPEGRIIDRFTDEHDRPLPFNNIYSIIGEPDGSVLLGSNTQGIFRYHIHTRKYTFHDLAIDASDKRETNINQLYRDSSGRLWAATMRHGLLQLDDSLRVVGSYTLSDGLPSNNICSLIEGDDGKIWLTSPSAVSSIDPETRRIRSFRSPEINEFSFRSAVKANNRLYFGGDRGLCVVDPTVDRTVRAVPPVIKRMVVDNRPLDESACDFRSGRLRLERNQATVSFDFRSLDYIDPAQIRYSYMLSGINSDWSAPRNIDNVHYANLPAGRYTFRVKAFKGDGDAEGVEGESVSFRVPSPMWCRGWAVALYLAVLILLAAVYRHWLYTKLRMQNALRIKQQEKEQSERIHNERINLFTNFSHELRTPLTLIKAPLEELIAHGTFPDRIRHSLRLMHANTERLLSLVNQLLDFRKQETGSMKIKVAEGDFAAFTEEIVVAFRELAASRGIEIDFRPEARKMPAAYDPIMEKVLFNLLSNALKNTPEGGRVVVRLTTCNPSRIRLEVLDTGCGIAPDELNRIFDPFYQTAIGNTSGTGIGLSLTKGIVELHHGTITVESAPERGSLFRVEWPSRIEDFAPGERDEKRRSGESLSLYLDIASAEPAAEEPSAPTAETGERSTILVADDNRELRKYIRRALCDRYRVIEAADGDKAVRLTLSHLPDLVVSDVMMPGKDGIEVCRTLKNDLRTSHIPVILLTACSTMTQIEDGLKIGADDYITKPFNTEHLKLRIANLLHMREHLRQMFGKPFELNGITYETITSPDERFLQKLYTLMKEHMSDPALNLDLLCSEIGMSRTSMYYKIKTLTGLTPTEFIRNHRLQTAARLLKEKKIPISEVSVIVGFNNHSYFSNCFRKMFGCPPSEYGELHV